MPRPKRHWRVADSPRGSKIVRFLRRDPIPDKIVATDDLEGEKTIAVRTKAGNVKWTDVSNACFACRKLVAMNVDGEVLRELELDPNDPELDGAPELVDQKLQAREDARLPGREPIISVDVPALVKAIADAMKDVAKSSAEQNAQAHATGMDAMASVVNTCLSLMQRVEERLADRDDEADQLAEDRRALLTTSQPVEGEPSMRDQLIQAALQKALVGDGAAAPNGHAQPDQIDPQKAAQLLDLINSFSATTRGGPAPTEGS